MHEEGDHATKKQLSGSLLQGDGLEKRLEQWECILHDQHGRLLPQRLANGPLPHHHFAQICRKEEAPLLLSPHTSKKVQLQNLNRPLLTELAWLTGGRVFELADVRQLDDSIPMREVTRTLETRDGLWDAPLLFIAIILSLTAEWVLRKVYRMV